MNVGDRLGKGSSFGSVPRGRRTARGQAKAVAQGDVPSYELVRLRLDEVAPTPLNPRRNFGTDEDQTRFGEELRVAQLAACVAVTRGAYLKLWPDHEARIGAAVFVLVNGERRYRSAVHVGLEALDFVVRDDLASSREEFVNHLLKENLEREDFDVIERARGVQEMVAVCSEGSKSGARTRAAQRLGRDRSWVTNQLALLRLPDEIQAMLSSGDMSERDGRLLARHAKDNPGLDAAGLLDVLKQVRAEEAAARQEERAILQAARDSGAGQPAVLSADNTRATAEGPRPGASDHSDTGTPGGGDASRAGLLSADNKPETTAAAGHGEQQHGRGGDHRRPGSRSGDTGEGAPDVLLSADNTRTAPGGDTEDDPYVVPWGNPHELHELMLLRMTRPNRIELAKLLLNSTSEP